MFFQKLSPRLQEAVKSLTIDKEFQDLFGSDKILDALDEETLAPKDNFNELLQLLDKNVFIADRKFKPITLKLWVYLWAIESPLARPNKEVTNIDIDLFFYMLDNGFNTYDPVELFATSLDYCKRNEMSEEFAAYAFSLLVKSAFAPLKMFPGNSTSDELKIQQMPVFDVDYCSTLISKVHSVTGLKPEEILDMPMNTCCYYYVSYAREQGMNNIGRRDDEEILIAKDKRACRLIVEFLNKKGIISNDEVEEIYNVISTDPNENK